MSRLAFVICCVASAICFALPVHAQISGPASVTDGDTLRIGSQKIRLHGIDAPESRQTCKASGKSWRCGAAATRALRKRIAGRTVACDERDRDRYGRIVAVCRVAGKDVNAWMVSQGWAVAYRKYSRDYVSEESAAKSGRRGLWKGEFVPPSRWRRGERLETVARTDSGACQIKGNISRSGKRIYHVPGGRWYERTRIDISKGERWFCSHAEAQAAGWRQANQ